MKLPGTQGYLAAAWARNRSPDKSMSLSAKIVQSTFTRYRSKARYWNVN
jgi:hypothetical protein